MLSTVFWRKARPVGMVLVALAIMVLPLSPAVAEDFNFEIPLEIDIAPIGASRILARIECIVSSAIAEDGRISIGPGEVIASRAVLEAIDPTSGSLHRVLTIRLNAEIPGTASRGRYYMCRMSEVIYYFGDSITGWTMYAPTIDANYRLITGQTITRAMMETSGEIPR
jgi:hypothetical protein